MTRRSTAATGYISPSSPRASFPVTARVAPGRATSAPTASAKSKTTSSSTASTTTRDTEDFLNGASYVVRPPPDALAEFKVQTSDYSAEFGHSAGAVVNATIKSGTNRSTAISGSTSATTLWMPATTSPPPFRSIARISSAARRIPHHPQQALLLCRYRSEPDREGYPTTISVPTALERTGNFSELLNPSINGTGIPIQLYQPGSAGGVGGTAKLSCNGQNNVFCPGQMSQVALNILKMYPLPNANNGAVYNNYNVNLNTTNNTFQWDARMDWNISSKDQAFGRFSYSNMHQFSPSPLGSTLDGYYGDGNFANIGENLAVSETHVFNPNLINEFRFGYNYGNFTEKQFNSNTNVSETLGLGGIPFVPGSGRVGQRVARRDQRLRNAILLSDAGK